MTGIGAMRYVMLNTLSRRRDHVLETSAILLERRSIEMYVTDHWRFPMSATSSSRAHASFAVETVEPILRVVESDPKASRNRRAVDNGFLAVMLLSTFLFAASLVNYVLSPAATTVASSSTNSSQTTR